MSIFNACLCCLTLLVAPALVWSASQQTSVFEQIYKYNCAACHGEKGDGKSRAQFGLNPSPRDFTTGLAREELSRERMVTSVTFGRPGTAMVGWGKRLSEDEINGIVDYVRATFMSSVDSKPANANKTTPAHPGKPIYKEHCAVCHGDDGNGATWTKTGLNPPPRDFTSAEARSDLSPERLLISVTHGRPGTAMMPFSKRLSAEQIKSVVDYIHTTFVIAEADIKAEPAVSNTESKKDEAFENQHQAMMRADMTLPFPNGLTGDPDKGHEFFSNNCFTCHGKQGDGHGPRAKFIYPKPRNFLAAESRQILNRPILFRAISNGKPGTVMPSWNKVLSDQQIADVAEYVFQAFIQRTSAFTDMPDQASHNQTSQYSQKKKAINKVAITN